MYTVQDALKARKERSEKEQNPSNTNTVKSALENYKRRVQSESKNIASDLAKRIKSEVEWFTSFSEPSWGKESVRNYKNDTKTHRSNVSELRMSIDSYKNYLDEELYNNMKSELDHLDSEYKNQLKVAEGRSQFASEGAYNQYVKEYEEYRKKNPHVLLTEDALNATDFDHYSQIGANIKNPSPEDAEPKFVIGQGQSEGEPVGNVVTYSRDNAEKIRLGEINGGGSYVGRSIYKFMTDDEVSAYNYYIGKGDTKTAERYLEFLEDTLKQREGGQIAEHFEGNKVGALLFGLASGIEQFAYGIRNLDNIIMGAESDPLSATQYAAQIVGDNMEGGWGVAYDLAQNTGNMLPSILLSSVTGGIGGAATMGVSATGNAYAEMRNLGYDENQSRAYGVLVGASEGLLQYALGGISKLGGKVTGNAISKAVSSVDNALARTAIKLGGSMFSEGVEESVQSVLEPIFKSIVTGEDVNIDLEEVAYSGLLGALSAGVLEGTGTVAGEIGTWTSGKKIKTDASAVERLTKLGSTMSADSVAYKLAGKIDENTGAYTIGRLLNEVGASLSEKNMSDIVLSLERKGFRSNDARTIAKWLYKAVEGDHFNKKQREVLEKNDLVAQTLVDVVINPNSTVWQRIKGYEELQAVSRAKTDKATKAKATSTQASAMQEKGSYVTKSTPEEENATEREFEASENGKTILKSTGEEVHVQGIESIENGAVKLKLDNGETVKASDVAFGSDDEALMYEMVVRMDTNPETAKAVLDVSKPSESFPAKLYFADVPLAYEYGKMNYEAGLSNLTIPEETARIAYNRGRIDAITNVKAREKVIAKNATATEKSSAVRKGKVHYDGGVLVKNLTDRQKASLKGLEALSEALGVDFHIFESKVDSNGRRYYVMQDGTKTSANGWFEPKDGSIHIDLFAGQNGEGTMLFTAAHELTHFIREWSPAKFKVFADFLMEQYGKKGVHVDALVKEQIAKAKRNGRDIDYDTAYEEVVADACETMLADGDVVQKIAKLKAKDESLWQKIKDFITNLVAKIKKAYEGLSPDSNEGQYVAEMLDTAEKLKAMWTEALVDASGAYTASDIVEIDSETESVAPAMMSERTWTESEYVTEREMTAKKISKELGVPLQTAYKYIDDINGVAKLIADDRARLDYEPNLDEKATVLKPNSEYKYSVDMSTLCAKRLLFTGTFDAIQRALPNTVFESEDIVSLREMMQKRGYEVACGICYVESTRREIGRITQEFIDRYKVAQKTGEPISRINSNGKEVVLKSAGKTFSADKHYTPNLGELNTTDIDIVKRDHREVYDAYLAFMNARGQAKPKLLETRAEYKGEILKHFKAKSSVEARNKAGGLRLQSFSDFEVPHMIDMMQIVMDMSRVGLKSQAYTKVPAFAEIFGDSGVKINLSLIAKGDGLDANGNLIFDDVEGINHKDAFKLRDKYSKNVGTILVGKTDAHIIAAMADPRIDYIIPFHKSSWKESLYDALGLTGYEDYTDTQNEKPIDTSRTIKNFDPSEYWDFTKSGDENAQIYLKKCRKDGRIPKFPQFQGYPGYWKLLIDFKMYDNDGVGSPQEVVKPVFNNEASERILGEYKGGHKSFPVAKDVVEDFVKEHKDKVKYSDRDSSYMDAVNRGDMETAQRMVDEAAKEAGYTIKAYHATNAEFTVFDVEKTSDINYHGKGIYFTNSQRDVENNYENYEGPDPWNKIEGRAYELLYDKYGLSYEDTLTSDSEIIEKLNECYDEAISEFKKSLRRVTAYLRFDNPLVIGKDESVKDYDLSKYDGIIDNHVYENIGHSGMDESTVHYVVLDPRKIKSADAITYDDNGNVVNLSERFNTKNPDIRYSDRYQSANTNTDILSMVEKVGNGNFKANEKVNLGTVSDSTATEIHKITGIDVAGFNVAIEARQIAHILKDHGKNGKADRSMADPTDIAKIEYTLENYDDISSAGKTRAYKHIVNGNTVWVDTVLYEKAIGSKSYYVVQAIPDTKAKTLYIVTAFIGKKGYKKEASQFIDEKIPDATPKSEIANTSMSIISQSDDSVKSKFSDRDPNSVSNRSLLANALEGVAQNDIERNKLNEYKSKISLIESEQKKLSDLNAKLKELRFSKGKRSFEDKEQIKELQSEANMTANRINTYDRQLLNLESTKALKGVLEREKAILRKKLSQEAKEALNEYREKAKQDVEELSRKYRESRKKGIESRHKTEMRRKIKDVVNELNQYLLKGTKEKHVPIELQSAVAEALDAVNMDTIGAEERIAKKREEMMRAKTPEAIEKLAKEIRYIEEMGGNMEAKLSRLKTAYDSIINSDDPMIANSHDEVISNTITKVVEVVGNTPLRDMSMYQLEAVYDMYKMVLASIRNTNNAFKMAKSEDISTLANRVIKDLVKQKRKTPYSKKALEDVSKFNWNNLKPVYAFERIGSSTFTNLFNNIRAGEDVWAKDMSEAQAFREDQFKKYNYDSWDFDKRYGFTSTTGNKFELSLDQIMSLYAYSRRDQAEDHLRYGGFVFDELTEVKERTKSGVNVTYKLTDSTPYKLDTEVLSEIVSKLTPEQKAFVIAMQDYLSTTMGEKGNEVSLALYDVKLFKEKRYFPLKSDKRYLARAREQAMGDVKIKNSGFTKEITPKAKNPITLTPFMDVWAGHVNEMSMYHAFTLPLEDFYRVYNYSTPLTEDRDTHSVVASIENAHRSGAVSYIDQLLKDLNGGAVSDSRETLSKSLVSNFKKASVIASLSVVIQQPSAIVRAKALVDAKYFVGSPAKGTHKEKWAEVKKYAPVAIIKEMGYFDVGMGKGAVDWLKGEKTWKDKMGDALSKAPSYMDEVTWVTIWNAVKRETLHTHKELKPNSEAFLKAVGERFTEVIVKTQVYDSTLARSANMRSKSLFMNMATAFMAEPTTSINMIQDSLRNGKRGKYTLRILGAVYGSVLLNAALVSVVYAMRDDDEDETFLEKYLSRLTTEVIDGVNPATYIPFLKDIWSILQGYDIERADMSLFSDVTESFTKLVKVIGKDTSDMDEDELADHRENIQSSALSVVDSVASLLGLPVKNVRRDFNGIVNGFSTIFSDTKNTAGSLADKILEDVKDTVPVLGWLPDESKGDKLYDAIVSGDSAYVDRLKNGYENEKSYTTAIRKALRDNDPRIKEAAEASFAGDTAEYSRIFDEILGEGNFELSDIKAAIDAEIDDLEPDEPSSEGKDKVVSRFEVEHFYNAVIQGDTKTANNVKEDIVNTHVANGKDRDEAESSFESAFRRYVRENYVDGEIDRNKTTTMLTKFGGRDSNDAYWDLKEWEYEKEHGTTDEYSKYNSFYEAVKTGRNIKSVINEYTSHGVTTTTLATQITQYYKPLYLEMTNYERASIKGYLLNAYVLLGYDRSKKSKDIDKWLEK